MFDAADFGRRVRIQRRKKNITQNELARRLGIAPSFMGHIERGTRAASLETMVDLCNELDISPDHLLEESLSLGHDPSATDPARKLSSYQSLLLRFAYDHVDNVQETDNSDLAVDLPAWPDE